MKNSREGENIAFEVKGICEGSNRRLQVFRARFSALIQRDLEQSLRDLKNPNKNESDAVDIRMELDLRIGYAFTRFQTVRWRQRFDFTSGDGPISYGPCQFPTLGFVVDQYWKHKHFRPEPFWYLDLEIIKEGKKCKLEWSRVRLFDHLVCLILYEKVLEPVSAPPANAANGTKDILLDTNNKKNGKDERGVGAMAPKLKCQVVRIQKKTTRKYRPFPLTTVELQRNMSRIMRISSKEAMDIAEGLYQAGFISYPRTETDRFPANFDFMTLIDQQTQHPTWGQYAQRLMRQGQQDSEFLIPKAGRNDDGSHPPIHPTKPDNNGALQGRQAEVYEFVVRHYLACCSQDAIGNETIVEVCVSDAEMFHTKGLSVEKLNYLEIYRYQKWSEATVPNFIQGELLDATRLTMESGSTTAPPLLTESDLIQLMNKNGIGTDATIAEHIATIMARKYVVKQGTRMEMLPTPLGEALVAGYNFIGFRKLNQPQLRADLESDLKRVCLGQLNMKAVLEAQIEIYKGFFNDVRKKGSSLDRALAKYFAPAGSIILQQQPGFSRCGHCGSMMSLQLGNSDFVALFCGPCNLQLKIPNGTISSTIDQEGIEERTFNCPICNFQVVSVTSRNGKIFTVCPSCYSDPPPHLRQNLTIDNITGEVQKMPCFKCPQQGCALRGSTVSFDSLPVRACPSCSSDMIIRQSKNGPYMLSCSNYPTCRKSLWFPSDIVKEVRPTDVPCASCSHRKPNLLVDIFYTAREVFETGVGSIRGCLYGCTNTRAVYSLLEEITHGFVAWEATIPPVSNAPVPVKPTKATTAKAGAAKRAASTAKSGSATTTATKRASAKGTSTSKATSSSKAGSAKTGFAGGAKKGFGAKPTTSAAFAPNYGTNESNGIFKQRTAASSASTTPSTTPNHRNPFISPHVQIHRPPHLSNAAKATSSNIGSANTTTNARQNVFGPRK